MPVCARFFFGFMGALGRTFEGNQGLLANMGVGRGTPEFLGKSLSRPAFTVKGRCFQA